MHDALFVDSSEIIGMLSTQGNRKARNAPLLIYYKNFLSPRRLCHLLRLMVQRTFSQHTHSLSVLVLVEHDIAIIFDETALRKCAVERTESVLSRNLYEHVRKAR
jgi:hypothetical protein